MEFVAHVRENDKKKQSVMDHCKYVSQNANSFVDGFNLENITFLQGYFHDVGKMNTDFNMYILKKNNIVRGEIDHSFAGAKYLYELAKGTANKALIETSIFIGKTIVSHHAIHDWISCEGEDYFIKRVSKNDRYEEIKSNIDKIIGKEELLDRLNKASLEYKEIKKRIYQVSNKNRNNYAFYLGMFERLMQSVLIDADRIDTADFMSNAVSDCQNDYSDLWNKMRDKMNELCDQFRKCKDFVSLKRMDISNRCYEFAQNKIGACKLIVPTGGGKTLSSLRFAIEQSEKFCKQRIIYVAPFMSILEQNSDVIELISGKENLLEHYSNIAYEIDDAEEYSQYELHAERWDKPVIATTLVQFLNTLFSGKISSVRRVHRLSNSVIIVDEVQAIPTKCIFLFNMAVNFLVKICDCCVVLCSATQPEVLDENYRIIFDDAISMTGDYKKDFKLFERTKLINATTDKGYTYDDAVKFCFNKFEVNDNLLVVVNTKLAAEKIYKGLKEIVNPDTKVLHISTNMCPNHRRKVLSDIRELLAEKQRVICVTTQLIEAGVDISFKCAIRSLAGLDNAIQTAGRCNRTKEYDVCDVYLINLIEENLRNLEEIRIAQKVTSQIINNENIIDLSSTETLANYFKKFYLEQKNLLKYPVNDETGKTTIISLLSYNENRRAIRGLDSNNYGLQAFATAGKLFKVIDNSTIDVIVPYDKCAEDLILKLNSNITPNEISTELRNAQKYIVSLYSHNYKFLEEKNAISTIKCGALVLKKEYYDDDFGLNTDGKEMELLII